MGSYWGRFRVPFIEWRCFHVQMYDPPSPLYHGRVVSRVPFGERGFFHGNLVYYFVLFRIFSYLFLGGCVWGDCLFFAAEAWKAIGFVIVSPLSQLFSSLHPNPSLVQLLEVNNVAWKMCFL
jgi:hypothetical protein